MPTTVNTSSNYAGKVAGGIIGASFKQADTLRLGLVTVAENVNYKLNLRKIANENGTTDYTCGFVPTGSMTLSEKVIEPKKLMVPGQICKEDFRQTWSEDEEGASAWNVNAPSTIIEAVEMQVLDEEKSKVDDNIWQGTEATDGEFGGLINQFAADGNIIKANNGITALNAATTEANVLAHLKAAFNAVPLNIRRKDLTVAVSPDVFQFYWFLQTSNSVANDGNGELKQIRYGRYTLTEVGGLPDNTIVIFEKKNVVFATGLLGDHNSLEVQDEDEIGLMTGQIRYKMVYNAGVGYYNSEEIVWLLTTTA